MLSDVKDAWLLRQSAQALAQVGTMDSIPVLEKHLFHRRAYVRWVVQKAIAQIRERYDL